MVDKLLRKRLLTRTQRRAAAESSRAELCCACGARADLDGERAAVSAAPCATRGFH